MPYLIDGNNLLGVVLHRRRGDPETRSRLVSSLSRFARTKGCRILLFFDGPKEYDLFPLASDLELFFSKPHPETDILTLIGDGEPLLFSPLGELVDFIKERYSLPTALITNGSLLALEERIRADAAMRMAVHPASRGRHARRRRAQGRLAARLCRPS